MLEIRIVLLLALTGLSAWAAWFYLSPHADPTIRRGLYAAGDRAADHPDPDRWISIRAWSLWDGDCSTTNACRGTTRCPAPHAMT
jgi:hypothetical protein